MCQEKLCRAETPNLFFFLSERERSLLNILKMDKVTRVPLAEFWVALKAELKETVTRPCDCKVFTLFRVANGFRHAAETLHALPGSASELSRAHLLLLFYNDSFLYIKKKNKKKNPSLNA